jgi:hypothetical protein
MANRYCVQYSDDDLVESSFTTLMNKNVKPSPSIGNFVVKSSGIYEITYVAERDFNYWSLMLAPITTQCKDGDLVAVKDKDRLYRCRTKDGHYGFERYTLVSLIDDFDNKLKNLHAEMNNHFKANNDKVTNESLISRI